MGRNLADVAVGYQNAAGDASGFDRATKIHLSGTTGFGVLGGVLGGKRHPCRILADTWLGYLTGCDFLIGTRTWHV